MRSLDISRGGLKLEANFDLRAGESVDLVLLMSGTRIRCRGRILAVEDHDHKVQARVRFTRAFNLDEQKLSNHLPATSITRLQKGLIGGLFIVVGAFLAVMIGYNHYFQSGLPRRVVKKDISARRASDYTTEETEPPTGTIRELREAMVPVPPPKAGLGSGEDVQEISEDLIPMEPPEGITEFRAQSTAIRDGTQGPYPSRLEQQKPGKVSKPHGVGFLPSSGRQIGATVLSEGVYAREGRPVIHRSVIALGVEDRKPLGILQRVSVRQGRVYCWVHVINDKGGIISVRWLGAKGQTMAEVRLPIGSNSWRTWSYLSLGPSMIGPAQVEIRDENGELLETLSLEITE